MKTSKMKTSRSISVAAILTGLLMASQVSAAASGQADYACKPVNVETHGTNSTGGAIKPLDMQDPYYTQTLSVDIDNGTYCVLTRCDNGMIEFAGEFGDELATTFQRSESSPDIDGDLFAVYEAINPKTNTMRLRIIYYDITALYMVGDTTMYATCTTAKFTNGGLPAAQ